nr:hypothetical protein [Acinetobacter baumannii]
MMHPFDFALLQQSPAQQESSIQSWYRKIQQFSLDSDIKLNDVLSLPFYFIDDYYASPAWKLKKEAIKKDAQMYSELSCLLAAAAGLNK